MPHLARITIYPVKSLDGAEVPAATILASGALAHDREFSLWDVQGRIVNGKRDARIHLLRSAYDWTTQTLSLRIQGTDRHATFHVHDERAELEAWLNNYFGFHVKVNHDTRKGFADDPDAYGPTVVSTATFAEVASWFPDLDVPQTRRRFRANLEIDGGAAFWEDRLVADEGYVVRFQLGDVTLEGLHLCPRCAVPSRDPLMGSESPRFQRIFAERRRATLPPWAAASRFDHFYYLVVGTQVPASEAGKVLHVGDEVTVLGVAGAEGQRALWLE